MKPCNWQDKGRQPKVGHTDDNQFQRRNIPLLRLNSTGEISSDSRTGENIVKMCKACESPQNSSNFKCLKNLVELNMNSVLESAGSYFGGLCQSSSSNKLTRCQSEKSMLEKYFKDIQNRMRSKGCTDMGVNAVANHRNIDCSQAASQGTPNRWSNSIYSALQCGLKMTSALSSERCSPKPTPYVPPHLKRSQCMNRVGGITVDPRLTPYNARLLQKSKQQQCPNHEAKGCSDKTSSRTVHENNKRCSPCTSSSIATSDTTQPQIPQAFQCKPTMVQRDLSDSLLRSDDIVKDQNQKDPVSCAEQKTRHDSFFETCKGEKHSNQLQNCHSDNEASPCVVENADEKHKVTDWFDYENRNEKTIPINVDLVCRPKSDVEESSSSPILHSWLSTECDAEVMKTGAKLQSCGSSQVIENNRCDNIQRKNTESKECDKKEMANAKTSKVTDGHSEMMDTGDFRITYQFGVKKSDSASNNDNMSVLYIRSCPGSKKSRPSSKKRRRQKAQQQECSDTETNPQADSEKKSSKKSPKKNSSKKDSVQNSTVAFILGLDPSDSQSQGSQSFHVSCDINSDSEWSDSDLECDGDTSEEDPSVHPLDWFSNQLGLMNFAVTCSVQPQVEPQNSSHLDAVNLSWRVNVSVSPSDTGKKKSTKKVSFAEDKDLATVHNMVAWDHAYRSARKGPWEEYARDRGRFQRRITEGNKILQPILDIHHRKTVYKERFEHFQ